MQASTVRILAVDDHRPTLEFLDGFLGRHGYQVVVATTGTEALQLVDRERVDLVILDLRLPDIDGLTVCRELRERTEYLPVLMLTARDTTEDEIAGFDAAADDYVRKPVDPQVLLARIQALQRLAWRTRTKDTVALVDGIEVDLAMRCIRRPDDRDVRLRPRAFDLLVFLLEHPGRVWSKRQLLTYVWGDEGAATGSAVEHHIAAIRAALGDTGNEWRYVLTRGKEGYLLPREVLA
jgi:DNA-binding response OmpR family regulator